MEKIASDAGGVTIRLTRTEFRIANNSLNEVTNGIRIPDTESLDWVARAWKPGSLCIGSRTPRTPRDWSRRRDQAKRPALREGMTVCLGTADLALLRNAMIELTKGAEVEEWEYPIRLGATVAEGNSCWSRLKTLFGAKLCNRRASSRGAPDRFWREGSARVPSCGS